MKQIQLLIFILSMAILPQFSYAAAAVRTASETVTTTAETEKSVKSLSKNERKALKKAKRGERKSFKEKIRSGFSKVKNFFKKITGSINLFLLIIITILIPPLGVFLHEGAINSRFWLSLLLTILFYFPGLIYSLIIILKDR